MNKKSKFLFLIFISVFISSALLSGCYLTSQLIPVPSVSINIPAVEFPSETENDRNVAPLPIHLQFEQVVAGKVWYTRLQNDGSYNKRCQTKLRINPNSKTFTKETYYWERNGNSNTYSYSGVDVQTGNYFYTQDNNQFEYELVEDYFVNAYSSRRNNSYNRGIKSIWYNLDNSEMITWDGKQYISKQALANQSVVDYTTRRDITLNY